ncbi:hypothetical protein EBU71_10560 [bacterium]|nr:hypothetical protein [Candidatus Elulimicrobium humile]
MANNIVAAFRAAAADLGSLSAELAKIAANVGGGSAELAKLAKLAANVGGLSAEALSLADFLAGLSATEVCGLSATEVDSLIAELVKLDAVRSEATREALMLAAKLGEH